MIPDKVYYWQLYISAYTALLGIPLLLYPKTVIPYLGLDPAMGDAGLFVRLTGMFLLCLTLITFRIWQKKVEEMVVGTVVVRLFIIITFLLIAITEGYLFLYFIIIIVGIGVIGTILALGRENFFRYL